MLIDQVQCRVRHPGQYRRGTHHVVQLVLGRSIQHGVLVQSSQAGCFRRLRRHTENVHVEASVRTLRT
ncbi:hypothetical protein GCM10027586_10890 [Kineococcus gypseus]